MRIHISSRSLAGFLLLFLLPLLAVSVMLNPPGALAQPTDPHPHTIDHAAAPCAGGPTIDGILLDECFVENFTVGGVNKSITVWYTKNTTTATRMVDGSSVTLEHWIDTDAEAQQVAAWGREAWERFFEIFGRHPYDTGCGNNINVQMEDGVGWGGIAYWASSGSCRIGIDSPMVRNGGGQGTVYHEFQHYLQYAYDDGCYADLQANYNGGAASGNAEFVEGYADLGADAVDATVDASGYSNAVFAYDPTTSMFDKSYGNVYNKYYMEQLGSQWTPADPHHHMDAVREHYEECDVQDTLYVLDSVIPSLMPGMSEQRFFLNFFAANWAKNWADPATQPELLYTDDDGNSYGNISLLQNVNMASGTQSWNAQPAGQWAGGYYQIQPQAGCPYVTVDVDGTPGSYLGINLMAADTVAPTSVSRSAWMGENFSRTFAGAGVHNRIVAAVNGFATSGTFDVSFACVTPTLNILEPRQSNRAWVGEPTSPIAFLARFQVTSSDGNPVRGLPASSFTADAEGDAITFIPGSFQEVGEEYWVVMQPPTKPVGTTLVDLRICLDGSICDTETDALLYVDPGNTDFALVFDASGSMATEDVPGEGTRLVNAKKAGTVLADLLRVGDRILVTDFSAFNTPAGCGLPGGSGNCPLDLRTHLARTDVAGAGTITAAKAAIDMISAREWTPIAAALLDAKNKLLAAPFGLNPKHIILLSDGEENVNPLYASARTELIDSGVIINTIAFSGEAPEALMAQIAADTGGTYRFVPTTGGSLARLSSEQADEALAAGVPQEMVERMAVAALPGPLGLDNVYDYLETKGQGASRLFHMNYTDVPLYTWRTVSQHVDKSVTTLRFVVASKQGDFGGTCSSNRIVEVLPPGADPRERWIPISPPTSVTPVEWDVRNSLYDDVVFIPNPAPGTWQIRTQYSVTICRTDENGVETVEQVAAGPYDVMVNGSAESEIRLQGRFLDPIVANQGLAGDTVPIVATLLGRGGAIPGASVAALIERPVGAALVLLRDDGLHMDGAAGDGIYGTLYGATSLGGTYNVRIVAFLPDPAVSGQNISREWMGGFWINGPERDDKDQDGMPDDWEQRCKLNPSANDARGDADKDGLTNLQELQLGTIPCDPDTDNGGERDGSEVRNQRNPLYPKDDKVLTISHVTFRPLNQSIRIHWTHAISYTDMLLYVSTTPGELGQAQSMGRTGHYTLTNLVNDQTYYLTLAGVSETAEGSYSETTAVTPKGDPDAPGGTMLINEGALLTYSREVMLNISATDTPLPGVAQSSNAHTVDALSMAFNQVSGDVEMRLSNDPTMEGAAWEPLAAEKAWTLPSATLGVQQVYIQFRDAAGNESFIVSDSIELAEVEELQIFLPLMIR